MPRTIFERETRAELIERLSRLRADAPARFGTLSAPRMICHLKDSLDVAMGDAPASRKRTIMSNPLLRRAIIYWLPWPKGKAKTVAEMLKTQPANWNDDVAQLKLKLTQAAERGPSADWARHPAFGNISGEDYGVLIVRHFDHHLKQFGV